MGMDRAISWQRGSDDSIKRLLEPVQNQLEAHKEQEEEVMIPNKRMDKQRKRLLWYNDIVKVKEQERQHLIKEVDAHMQEKVQQNQELECLRAKIEQV